MLEKLRKILRSPSVIYFVFGTIMFAVLMTYKPAFAAAGESLLVFSLFVWAFKIYDKHGIKNLDIEEELKNGNVAVAIYYGALAVSFAIILFACNAGSSVFKFLE